jgi:hypothetical protein
VGAKGAASDRLLEHVDSVLDSSRSARHVLHSVAKCKEVWNRRGEESLEFTRILLYRWRVAFHSSFSDLSWVHACKSNDSSTHTQAHKLFHNHLAHIYNPISLPFRESDQFFDEPFAESDMNGGVDNNYIQSQPLRSRDNIYEYKDSPVKISKSHSDFNNSVRSPSSMGMTQMTKISGSQSSLRSAISMKESPSLPTAREIPLEKKERYAEREIDVKSDKSSSELTDKGSVLSSSTITNASTAKRDYLTSSPVARPRGSKSNRTIIDGVPQTEV